MNVMLNTVCARCHCLIESEQVVHHKGDPFHPACLLRLAVEKGWPVTHPAVLKALSRIPSRSDKSLRHVARAS